MFNKIALSGFPNGINNFSFGMLFSVIFHGSVFFATIFALPFVVKKPIESVLKSQALAKASGKKAKKSKKGKKNQTKSAKNIAYYKIPVEFEINGNFIGYIKFKRALSLSNKMLNFDKESIQVVKGDSTGAIKVNGSLTIVGLPDEFF